MDPDQEAHMWLMTIYGFYSIVRKHGSEYRVLSRERKDLENLVQGVPLPHAGIMENDHTDYRFRIIVKKEDVLAALRFLGDTLDYSNFKNTIGFRATFSPHSWRCPVLSQPRSCVRVNGMRGHS